MELALVLSQISTDKAQILVAPFRRMDELQIRIGFLLEGFGIQDSRTQYRALTSQ